MIDSWRFGRSSSHHGQWPLYKVVPQLVFSGHIGAITFEEIFMSHVLEHVPDTVRTMEEIYRIASPSAQVIVKVPHYKHSNAFKDPTHVRFFTEETFDYFGKDPRSYYTRARFDVLKVEKEHDWHVAKYVARRFPRLLPWVERFFDNTVVSLTFVLRARK